MSPRLDPRRYVIRLAWLSRRAAQKGTCVLCACPRSGRTYPLDNGRTARSRWLRPFLWRYRP